MKTLLIPVDFSDVTENVLKYAADYSCDTHIERIILLKSFYISIYSQLLPSPDFVQLSPLDIEQDKKDVVTKLNVLSETLLKKCNPTIEIKTILSELPLLRAVHEVILAEHPQIMMIGSEQTKSVADDYMSEQLIAIAKTSTIPLLIIPHGLKYSKIEKAVLPCDFTAFSRLDAIKVFKDPSKWLHPHLLVLNVDPKQKHLEVGETALKKLAEFLDTFEYEVYYSEENNIVRGILEFADKNDAQIIMALPGKYSFFNNLTHKSITKALAINSHRAVLILK